MISDAKVLFNNQFFSKALKIDAYQGREFLIRYFTIDSRISGDTELYCFIGIRGENFDGNDFFKDAYDRGIRIFILEKMPTNIPLDAVIYLVNDTLKALADLALEHKNDLMIPSVLITGSVGKTTTRIMLKHILNQKYPVHTAKKNWNNHIGLPLTILETPSDAKISILEAGMSSKDEISYLSQIVQPEIAVITNVGLSHAEFIGGKDEVAECKIEIVDGMNKGSILLISEQDPYKELFVSKAKGNVRFFNSQDLEIVENLGLQGFRFKHKRYPEELFTCPIPGEHLLLNLAIVFECVDILHIPIECIHKGLVHIQEGLDDRMRVFQNQKGVTVIADCYNASLESFEAALEVLSNSLNNGRRIAVIGDILELGNQSESVHRKIGEKITALKNIDLVLATGVAVAHTCNALQNIPYCHFNNKEDIWEVLCKELQSNDTILIKASNGMKLNVLVACLENGSIM